MVPMACDEDGRTTLPKRAPEQERVLGFPMRKFLVVFLIFLVVAVVVGDVLARSFAQNTIASQTAQQMNMPEEPDVSIEGWAFLPQAISGNYSEINLSADSATVENVDVEQVDRKSVV